MGYYASDRATAIAKPFTMKNHQNCVLGGFQQPRHRGRNLIKQPPPPTHHNPHPLTTTPTPSPQLSYDIIYYWIPAGVGVFLTYFPKHEVQGRERCLFVEFGGRRGETTLPTKKARYCLRVNVCVGLAPTHHLMFEITDKPPRKQYPRGIF